MPTPAIPIPESIISETIAHCGIVTESTTIKGIKNKENMIIAFEYNFQFPVLLMLFSLKYVFTRLFRVLKNLALSTLEKLIAFM
jgi:hypothetical protein